MICVDKQKESPWRYGKWGHLFNSEPQKNGSNSRLHYFARQIGLKNSYFQLHALVPHYDLSSGKRTAAVSNGAQEVGMGAVKRTMRKRLDAMKLVKLAEAGGK